MFSLYQILFHPRQVASQIKIKPQWLVQCIALSILSIVIAVTLHPSTVELTIHHLPSTVQASDKIAVRQMLDQELGVRCAFLPVRLLVGWSCFSLMLFYLCKGWRSRESVRFFQLFSLEVHSEAALMLVQIASMAVMVFIPDRQFISVPFGLDIFASPSTDFAARTLLNSMNVFTVWYIVILAVGISTLYQFNMVKGLLTAVIAWLMTACVNTGTTIILRDAFHFNL